jgi:hypothetical protein
MRTEHAFGGRLGETAASAAPQQPVYPQQPITQASTMEGSAPKVFWAVASASAAGSAGAARFAAAASPEEMAWALAAAMP